MGSTRVFWRGLIVVGLIGVLGACGLAADRAADANQAGTAAQPRQMRSQPGTAPSQAVPPGQTAPAGQRMTLVRTTQLIGKDVKNTQGEKLGTVHDIVLTPDYQQVSYVAVSYGGAFGIGSKLYAVPWQALQVGPQGDITMSATKDQFQQATSFTSNNWPSQGDPRWLSASAARPGQTPTAPGQTTPSESRRAQAPSSMGAPGSAAMGSQEVQMRRVTHLTGMEVRNPESQDLGDIEDFAINTSDGHVMYDIIAFGGVAGVGEKYAAVPASAVRLQPQTHLALLNATKDTLTSVALSSSELSSNLNSADYMQRVSKLFPAAPSGTALGYVPAQSPQAQEAANERAWGPGGPYSKMFNPSTVKTIQGTVQSVGTFKPEGAPVGASGGLRLRVKTSDGQLVTVVAGPIWFAEQQSFFVAPGDQISITGSEMKMGARSVIVASEFKKGDQTLQLRDQSGKPLWRGTPQAMPPSSQAPAPGQTTQRPMPPGQSAPGQPPSGGAPGSQTRP